jgi:nitrogen regulatory protein P-II 1
MTLIIIFSRMHMRKIKVILISSSLDVGRKAFLNEDFTDLTENEVKDFGQQKDHKEIYKGAEYNLESIAKLKTELVCDDDSYETDLHTIIIKPKRVRFVMEKASFIIL